MSHDICRHGPVGDEGCSACDASNEIHDDPRLRAYHITAVAAARAEGRAEGLTWQRVGPQLESCPRAHARYLVRRNGLVHTATPCYGLHRPWWVVRTLSEDWPAAEAAPVDILPGDEWMPLPAAPAGVPPEEGK